MTESPMKKDELDPQILINNERIIPGPSQFGS
jgi:hypothetical protein